jgi:energy-coupling factor transporter ATP-binding protein EcfA2
MEALEKKARSLTQADHLDSAPNSAGKEAIREAARNSEAVLPPGSSDSLGTAGVGTEILVMVSDFGHELEEATPYCPIVPLGMDGGSYYLISPSGQLRKFTADTLEAGRGVRALFEGISTEVENWCTSMFPAGDNGWNPKQAGLWIIGQCNAKGVFDPSNSDLRSIGVWPDDGGGAVAHCGDQIVFPSGKALALTEYRAKHTMIGSRRITAPDLARLPQDAELNLLRTIKRLWGWKRDVDADIWLGWVAAACLGGFPEWRAHLYVHGSRGSGKSKLIELAARLLGDLSGDVVNDATEAGLRQSRNNQARPLLIDEFEPDDNPRNATRQDGMLALFRRMSGGAGGRISRGGSDHSPVSFRTLGAVYVTSINHIHMEPQDRSRFVVLELQSLPDCQDPIAATKELSRAFDLCGEISTRFRGKLLRQSERWSRTHSAISAKARSLGADARQASTAATILAGLDMALFDGDIDRLRMDDLEDPMKALIADSGESDEGSEGRDVLDHLLSESLPLDHGIKRTVRELVVAEVNQEIIAGLNDASGALRRHGIHVDAEKQFLALRSGRSTPTARLYASTKWRNGAHASALLKLEGVVRPANAIRFSPNEQYRVVLVPFACLGLAKGQNE